MDHVYGPVDKEREREGKLVDGLAPMPDWATAQDGKGRWARESEKTAGFDPGSEREGV